MRRPICGLCTKCSQGTHSFLVTSFRFGDLVAQPPTISSSVNDDRRRPSSISAFSSSVVVFENPPNVARARSRRFVLLHHERTAHERTRRIHKSREKVVLHHPCHRHEIYNPIDNAWDEDHNYCMFIMSDQFTFYVCLKESRVLSR